jgi:hypothetical protein
MSVIGVFLQAEIRSLSPSTPPMGAGNGARWLKDTIWPLMSRRRGRSGTGRLRRWRCHRCARCRVTCGDSKSNWRVSPIYPAQGSSRRRVCHTLCHPGINGPASRQLGRPWRRAAGRGSSTLLRRDQRAELPCVYSGGIGTWWASIPSLRTPDTRSPQRPLVVLGPKEFRMCGRTKR